MSVSCTQLSVVQKKSVQIKSERNVLGRLLLLSQVNDTDLEKVFEYQLDPVPWCFATADGGMVKTNKALLMHHLENKVTDPRKPPDDSSVAVIDGNAIIQAGSGLPETFGDLAWQIFCCLPKSGDVHFFHRLLS